METMVVRRCKSKDGHRGVLKSLRGIGGGIDIEERRDIKPVSFDPGAEVVIRFSMQWSGAWATYQNFFARSTLS